MTPYQLRQYIEVYNERKVEEDKEKLILVYLGASWQRAKRMPSIQKVLGIDNTKGVMSPADMLEEVKKINIALGGSTY